MQRIPDQPPPLVRRFAVRSLVAFIAVGVMLSVFLSRQIIARHEAAAEFHATFVSGSILRHELSLVDLSGPVTGPRAEELVRFIDERVLEYPGVRMKIWGRDGTILFSDERSLIGRMFPMGPRLREAFTGTASSEIADLRTFDRTSERGLASRLYVTAVPLRSLRSDAGEPVAAVEFFQDYESIAGAAQGMFKTLTVSLLAGLSLLYLALLPITRRATRLLSSYTSRVRRSEARFRSLVQNSSDMVAIITPDGTISYSSPSARHIFGYREEDLLGSRLIDVLHADDHPKVNAFMGEAAAKPNASQTVECRWRHADGSWRCGETTMTSLIHDPAIGGIVLNTRDISERKELENELTRQAFHDPLTGLANRALFRDRVDHALTRLARGSAEEIAVLFIDLDDFKSINDTIGHAAGDGLLARVAGRVEEDLRPADTAARLGGDEFAVLIEATDRPSAEAAAQRIIDGLAAPFRVQGRQIVTRASIGVALGNAETSGADELLRNADVAMYLAKNQGKGRTATFEPAMHEAVVDRLGMISDLRSAQERGEFSLRYQPVVDLETDRIVGAEALIRWDHPTRGRIHPASFIPLAEEIGLIRDIGRWVLDGAVEEAMTWGVDEDATGINVNLSARQLVDGDIVAEVSEVIARHGLHPGRLTLEITESVMMQDTDLAVGVLSDLKALGVRLAIDDFGTGYSSLSYLRALPVDILKIDRSFVSGVTTAIEESALMRAIIKVSQTMKLQTVGEGIETREQVDTLRTLRCDLGQGYYFAEPLTAEAFSEALQRDRVKGRAGLRVAGA